MLPDWVLADLVGTLRFPDLGGPRVDDVIPLAMAAMWVAPLFLSVALSDGRPGRAAALGWATTTEFTQARPRSLPARVGAALAVSTFYLGALVLSHFLIDVAGWRITA